MKTSTTLNKAKKFFLTLCQIFFWLSLWEISALSINNQFLLPGIGSTLSELLIILSTPSSYLFMFLTLIRVTSGLLIGIILGVGLAIIAQLFPFVRGLISPIITIIRSTPVASFIVILWILLNGDLLSVFIAFLMVMPIIWQSTLDGLDSIDPNLEEVAIVFSFGRLKRFKLIVLPTLIRFLVPAIITSAGLSWKAEIAAEIIAYTKSSIGQQINDAKYFMNTPRVFAWTVIIVLFSIIIEKGAKKLLKRFKNGY